MNVVSLFTGVGGIEKSAQMVNQILGREIFKLVACCEIDPYAASILRKRFPGVIIYDDIRTLTKERLAADGISRVDMLTGGFPCQPHSLAGRRKGKKDERNLWPEYLRLIGELWPRWVLGENVAGLLSSPDDLGQSGGMFGEILRDLATVGYDAAWSCYGAGDLGASDQRDRVFIVANPT